MTTTAETTISEMTASEEVRAEEARYLLQNYARAPQVLERGEGVYLFDVEGRRYLDFTAGIAVNALGHGDPAWAAVVAEQARRLVHVSNVFHTRPQVELARALVESCFADRVFFCNSGTEANEAALKFARRAGGGKTGFLAFTRGFHGRTMGSLAVTSKAAYREPFEPLVPGVVFAPFDDLEAAREALTEEICAVIVEPVQGEGGVHAASGSFLRGLRQLCDERGALLIFDEIQCGLGRTGRLWAHEAFGVTPDVLSVAKPLAGGLPIGAVLMTERVAAAIRPGDHGSTFAAGPLVCRAAQVVFERVSDPRLLARVGELGEFLRSGLREIARVREVRGAGLLVGVDLDVAAKEVIAAAAKRGLLILSAGEKTLRLCPPLILERQHVDEALEILEDCLEEIPPESVARNAENRP